MKDFIRLMVVAPGNYGVDDEDGNPALYCLFCQGWMGQVKNLMDKEFNSHVEYKVLNEDQKKHSPCSKFTTLESYRNHLNNA